MPPKKKRSRRKKVEVVADIQGTPELDKEELRIKLDNAEKRIRRIAKENEALQAQRRGADSALDDQKKEQVDICEHFLRELQKKEREANAAIDTIRNLEAAKGSVERDLTAQLEQERQTWAEAEAELTTRMGVLEARLQELDDFAKIKASVEAEVAHLRDKVVQMERNHKLDLEAQVRQYEMDKEKLRSDMVKKLKKTRDGLFKLADDHLSIKTQQTIKENERLTRELELYERESREMLHTNQRLTTDSAALRRNEQVLQESLEDQIKKSRSQQQTIKTLVQKVRDLETSLADAKGLATDDRNEKIAALSQTVDKQYEVIVDLKRQLDESARLRREAEQTLRTVAQVEADKQEQVRSARAFLVQCISEAMKAVEAATPGSPAELGLLPADDRQAVIDFLVRKLQLLERPEVDLPPIPRPPPPKSQSQQSATTPRKAAARPNRHSPVAQLAVAGSGYA